MKIIPLFGAGTFGKSAVVTRQRRVNCYYENRPDGDKTKVAIYGTPGLVAFFLVSIPSGAVISAIQGTQSALYAVLRVPVAQQQFISINPYSGTSNGQLLSATMVAGAPPHLPVVTSGYIAGNYGTLTPAVDSNGNVIASLISSSMGILTLSINSSVTLGQGYFSAITLVGGIINSSFTSASATYGYGGGVNTWTWSSSIAFTNGVSYAVTMAAVYGPILFSANLATDLGNVSLAYSPTQVLVVDSAYGYVYTPAANTFLPVSMWPAPAQTCTNVSGFFVIEQPGSQKFWVSNFQDATTWNSLAFASAASGSDNIVAVDNLLGNLVLFRQLGTEFWQNLGLSPQPFSPILSAANNYGLAALNSRGHVEQSLIFLAQNPEGNVQFVEIVNSYSPQVISDADVDFKINQYSIVSDAVALVYQKGQHKFYQCTFPTANHSWLFDCSTRQWSEVQTGISGRHLANLSTYYAGMTLFTDSTSGQIYTNSDTTYTDNGQIVVREIITRHVLSNFNRERISLLYIDMETGVGLQSGQGSNPQVTVEYSKDDGRTWSGPRVMSLGQVGQYQTRMVLRRFGSTRTATFRIRMSDPVKFVMTEGAIKIAERQPAEKLG